MMEKTNIYAVVVWYQPTAEQADCIGSYIDAVGHVIVVDNSADNHSQWLNRWSNGKYTYLPQGKNTGVATALNTGCCLAFARGAQWVLTMDQDSRWEQEQLDLYIAYADAYPEIERVGVFSPRQNYAGHIRQYANRYEEKTAVMTSGCLLSAKGFRAVGGFRDELFIDEVDNEYCMHIHRSGMQVVIINDIILVHHLGELRTIRLLGIWKKEYIDHAPFRFYYITRNILYLNTLYPEYSGFNNKRLRKMLKRIVLYDRRHKLAALRMCWRGWRDYRRGVVGPYERE